MSEDYEATSSFKKMDIDCKKYVVLDIETNGLWSGEDDILSISLYKPDDGKSFDKFLPLENADNVYTTIFNGIKKEDLVDATPLTQQDFDNLVEDFELKNRIILFYAPLRGFDDLFLRKYMEKHEISGFEELKFYNLKQRFFSSRYSSGNLTKDNLCILFGIPNVQKIHSGHNDCQLEWELFKKTEGYYYLVTEGELSDKVFRMKPGYIIPVSYLNSHINLYRTLKERPYIKLKKKLIEIMKIDFNDSVRLGENIDGLVLENLINSMLKVEKVNSMLFLLENKSKLDYVGEIPVTRRRTPLILNEDGSVKVKEREIQINDIIDEYRRKLLPVVEFIEQNIFNGEKIKSQELIINKKYNILSLCDLSSDLSVLEIKTGDKELSEYKEQLFYESNGRKCYFLQISIHKDPDTLKYTRVYFSFFSIDVHISEIVPEQWTIGIRKQKSLIYKKELEEKLEENNIALLGYINKTSPVKLQCKICGRKWEAQLYQRRKTPVCPVCMKKE